LKNWEFMVDIGIRDLRTSKVKTTESGAFANFDALNMGLIIKRVHNVTRVGLKINF
jgi:hypothetical protein